MASNNAACCVCMKMVLDDDEGVECDSRCQRWFHRVCVNISKSEYSQLAKDTNKKWHCNRVDCRPTSEDPIYALTTSVKNLLDKINSWTDKIEKITEVSSGIDEIKLDIGQIKDKLSSLEPRVAVNESKIENLVSEVESLKSCKNSDPESLIQEISDRSQRAKNAIIYGIPESASNEIKTRINHDSKFVNNILQSLDLGGFNLTKVIRIGKHSQEKPRPMKISFADPVEAIEFFKHFKPDVVRAFIPESNIEISRDRTLLERSHLKSLRKSLDARSKAGERDLTIKYQQGVPKIVKHSKN